MKKPCLITVIDLRNSIFFCFFIFSYAAFNLDPFEFKPDNNALQSILNNDGIRSTPSKRNTGVYCSSPFNQVNLINGYIFVNVIEFMCFFSIIDI